MLADEERSRVEEIVRALYSIQILCLGAFPAETQRSEQSMAAYCDCRDRIRSFAHSSAFIILFLTSDRLGQQSA